MRAVAMVVCHKEERINWEIHIKKRKLPEIEMVFEYKELIIQI